MFVRAMSCVCHALSCRPLHWAASGTGDLSGRIATAALLLERGADPIARDNRGQTPVVVAAARGDDALATMLLLAVPQPSDRVVVGTECIGHAVAMCARGSVRFTQALSCCGVRVGSYKPPATAAAIEVGLDVARHIEQRLTGRVKGMTPEVLAVTWPRSFVVWQCGNAL
jgi:hypothetical protein